jgi:hypothetical protein
VGEVEARGRGELMWGSARLIGDEMARGEGVLGSYCCSYFRSEGELLNRRWVLGSGLRDGMRWSTPTWGWPEGGSARLGSWCKVHACTN